MATPDLWVIKCFIVPDIVQKFQRPFANPELGYGEIIQTLIRTQLCVPIQIKVLVREKKKYVHTPPDVLYLMFKEKKKKTKKRTKKNQKRKKKKQKRINKQKNASDFSTGQRSTPLLPTQRQVSYTIHIYVFWSAGSADQRKSLHVLVLVTNFYIANVG